MQILLSKQVFGGFVEGFKQPIERTAREYGQYVS